MSFRILHQSFESYSNLLFPYFSTIYTLFFFSLVKTGLFALKVLTFPYANWLTCLWTVICILLKIFSLNMSKLKSCVEKVLKTITTIKFFIWFLFFAKNKFDLNYRVLDSWQLNWQLRFSRKLRERENKIQGIVYLKVVKCILMRIAAYIFNEPVSIDSFFLNRKPQ